MHDARPTVPAQVPVPNPPAADPPDRRVLIAIAVAIGLLALMLGLVVGRLTARTRTVVVEAESAKDARLGVTSQPEANVLVDGRFVGVSPIERVDLDAGKHSVVIDAFGYQPYAGTLEVEAQAHVSLKVVLAPIGGGSGTRTVGEYGGKGGKGSDIVVPPSALAPMAMTGTGTGRDAPKRPAGHATVPSSPPPSRPRRDCSGEKSQCRSACSSAESSCRFACPGCTSCLTSVGWDECNRQCNACRQGCEQNVKFCESSCESNYSSCTASQ